MLPRWRKYTTIIGSAALVAIGLIIGAGLAEVAYRGWLYRGLQDLVRSAADDAQLPFFRVYDKSLWEFDQRFGYVYPPGRTVHRTEFNGGKVVGCRRSMLRAMSATSKAIMPVPI